MGRIVVLVGLSGHIELLRPFLRYYAGLGADHFLVHINEPAGRGTLTDEALAMLSDHPHTVTDVWTGPHDWLTKAQYDVRAVSTHCTASDWVLLPDLDELHEFPCPLPELFRMCDERGCNGVRGRFLDRVAEGGELPELAPNECLFSQFPYGAQVTGAILQGRTDVLAAARGFLPKVRHFLNDGGAVRFGSPPHFLPGAAAVAHHFKWSRTAIERMSERYRWYSTLYRSGRGEFRFYMEGKRLLDYLEAHGGRFDLSDPELHAKWDGRCLFPSHPPSVRCRCPIPAPP